MRFEITGEALESLSADAVVEGLYQEDEPKIGEGYLPPELGKAVLSELKRRQFDSKEGEVCVLPLLGNKKIKYLIVVGVGKKRNYEQDQLRSIGAKAVKAANGIKIKKLIFHPDLIKRAKDVAEGVQGLTEGVELGSYNFSSYKKHTAQEGAKKHKLEDVVFVSLDRQIKSKIEKGLETGKMASEAVCLARDLVNTPSMDMHPDQMAFVAQSLAGRGTGITCKVIDKTGMEKLGMRASIAVGQGSVFETKLIHLVYHPATKKKDLKKIALVGKAVTFDSGGLSLKSAEHMIDMKIDMAGAASVLGVFKALPHLNLNVEVHGVFIAVENMPSGSAYRPGDVVSAMDGTTIEVENTDAEGRITLADAIAYSALKIKPDAIIDLATLTGAVIIALGSDVTALLSSNKELKSALINAANSAHESMWELPLYQPYKDLIKSKIADVKNVGGRPGGVITAALFLEKFTHNIPWAHLDIAGPSYCEKETRPEWVIGGTGWGVRLLLNYLKNL
ncbi:MAG: leucyl aminopeptidase [Patescibacteria group bacterium]|nr:leucyl aminopeptidase [Patescibacteria group bacterium]